MAVSSKKVLIPMLAGIALCSIGCTEPIRVEPRDVCSKPEGTAVTVEGYILMPEMMETIQQMSDGRISAVGYQPLLTADTDAMQHAVKLTVWTTKSSEPNRMRTLSNNGDRGEVLVYSRDGKELEANRILKLTGEIKSDSASGCALDVYKIEEPEL